MKLTKRLGPGLLEELNGELLRLAVERKVLRSRRLRVDSTFVEADISGPTDSGLWSHAVSPLTRLARRVERAGVKTRTRVRASLCREADPCDLRPARPRPRVVAGDRPAVRRDRPASEADGARGAQAQRRARRLARRPQ